MTTLLNSSLGRYHITSLLGEGGMATVYKAYDTRLETDVAIKVIRTEKLTEETKERSLKRFEREAKALARLTHPNIVKVTDYGEHEGKPYLVLPYLPGGTLKEKLGKPIPWQDAVQLLLPIAEALDYAHDQNMIHRDVKPANILLTQRGQPMLSDFGIAKLLDLEETRELTGTSAALGTPEYMAPEQARAKGVDHRADIYSLGIVLYEMVTGRKPFIADTPMDVLIMHARDPLPSPRKFVPDLPKKVEDILFKALAKQPADRYQSMEEFAAVLRSLLTDKPTLRPAPTPKPSRHETTESDTIKDFQPTVSMKPDSPSLEGTIAPGAKRSGEGTGVRSKLLLPASLALLLILCIGLSIKFLPSILSPTETPSLTSTKPLIFTPLFTLTPTFTLTPELSHTPEFTAILPIIPTATPLPTEITDPRGVTMRLVPAGTFTMGSDSGKPDERPAHDVYLDAYYIDQYEVTNALYKACVVAGVCEAPKNNLYFSTDRISYYGNSEFDEYPVIFVDWDMSRIYCEWRNTELPTEAQWEKAARGIDSRTYPWGEGNLDCNHANYSGCGGYGPGKVGLLESGRSIYGVYDMAGNVWEWIMDWYSETYYTNSPLENPLGQDTGPYRVIRGGSWHNDANSIRSWFREKFEPYKYSNGLGFRCARPAQ